jgi:hypothetical protein
VSFDIIASQFLGEICISSPLFGENFQKSHFSDRLLGMWATWSDLISLLYR